MKIMIVDDDYMISEELKEILLDLGYEMAGVVASGEEAIQMAPDLQPDVILMDIVMPGGMDGTEAARKIMDLIDCAVVFVTGYGNDEIVERAKNTEPHGYLLKPFEPYEIKASIEIAFHKKKVEDRLKKAYKKLEQDVAERATLLSRANEQLSALMNATSDTAVLIDLKGNVIAANTIAAERYGMPLDQFIGICAYDLMPPALAESRKLKVNKIIATGKPLRFEDRRGGIVFDSSISPVHNENGEVDQLAIYGKDITQLRKNLEALKTREKELKGKTKGLEDANTALSVLLRRREEDRIEFEERILSNVKTLIRPHLKDLKKTPLSEDQDARINELESSLEKIISPFARDLSSAVLDLTPMEIRVASLVKEGKTNKQMAELLSVSKNTILTHRYKIRTKLGIKGKKVDLKSHLLTFHK